jgi:hypothetical protein
MYIIYLNINYRRRSQERVTLGLGLSWKTAGGRRKKERQCAAALQRCSENPGLARVTPDATKDLAPFASFAFCLQHKEFFIVQSQSFYFFIF